MKIEESKPRTRTRIETRTKETSRAARRMQGGQEPVETRESCGRDPKDSELCLCWLTRAETPVEGLSRSDVQLDGRRWA